MFPFDDVITITVITITMQILLDYLTKTEKNSLFVLVSVSEGILKNMGKLIAWITK